MQTDFWDLEYVLLDTGREKRKLENREMLSIFKNLVILKIQGELIIFNDIEM